MLGYATLSETNGTGIGGELGCGFYKFSINSKGKVQGLELGQSGEPLWCVPVQGRATLMPSYCTFKVFEPVVALQNAFKTLATMDDVKESFQQLREMVLEGRIPGLNVADVISVAKQIRKGKLGNEWKTKGAAKEFGMLLAAIKGKAE